jgi:hypothetical protein
MEAHLLENLLGRELSTFWHFSWSDTSGSMAWVLFADKDVELGWLEYILSTDIGSLFPTRPWLLSVFCIHNSLIIVSNREIPTVQQDIKKGERKKMCRTLQYLFFWMGGNLRQNLLLSCSVCSSSRPTNKWHITNQCQFVSVNSCNRFNRRFILMIDIPHG